MSKVNEVISYDLKPSQVLEAMELADAIKDSLMIWGPPGIGKSAIAKQYADTQYPLRKDNLVKLEILLQRANDAEDTAVSMKDYIEFEASLLDQDSNFIDFRLSQIEPSDLRGIPIPIKIYTTIDGTRILESQLHEHTNYQTETSVVWASPDILKLNSGWKGVIIFDEINSAMPIVQAASYQLILDRRVGELVLPDTAFILAAGNRDTDGGVTFTLATPLRDRMTHVEMVPDYLDWIENYAIPNKLDPATVAFISNTGNQYFNTLSPNDKSHSGGSSPRSWTRVSEMEPFRRKMNISSSVYKAMVAGRVGSAIAVAYTTYVEHIGDLPDVMDILSGEITMLDPEKMDVSKNYFMSLNLVYKMISLHELKIKKELSADAWTHYCTNYIKFLQANFSKTQGELSILAMRTLTNANVNISYLEVPEFKTFVAQYGGMVRKARSMSKA